MDKTRGEINYKNIKKEKWRREIKNFDSKITYTDKKNKDYICDPSNYHKRTRSESPPPKKYRTKRGINKGKPGVCSLCRPEISIYMTKKSQMRKESMVVNKLLKGTDIESLIYENPDIESFLYENT